jgi:hypothetical protein
MGKLVDELREEIHKLNEKLGKVDTTKYLELKDLFTQIDEVYFISIDGMEI